MYIAPYPVEKQPLPEQQGYPGQQQPAYQQATGEVTACTVGQCVKIGVADTYYLLSFSIYRIAGFSGTINLTRTSKI